MDMIYRASHAVRRGTLTRNQRNEASSLSENAVTPYLWSRTILFLDIREALVFVWHWWGRLIQQPLHIYVQLGNDLLCYARYNKGPNYLVGCCSAAFCLL